MSGAPAPGASFGAFEREIAAPLARAWRRRDRTWLLVAAVLTWAVIAFAASYHHHVAVRKSPEFPAWWYWSDQGRYYRAARAWATFTLDPAQHWYFAGYPLLGAMLFRLMPGDPFVVVDLCCLLLTGVLFVQLAAALSTRPHRARAIAASVFLVTTVLTPLELKSFVEPWTTTPTAPLTLAAFVLAFRLWDRPTPARAAALALATSAVVLFRPADALPLALAMAAASAWALRTQPRRRMLLLVGAGLAGAAIPLALAAATYVAVFGLQQSAYLQQSAQTGFEWRLIPLHWVTLFVSPLPEFADQFSLSQTFPWIAPGVAGMAACLVAARGPAQLRHAAVISAVLLHCLLYLAYRDLHPQGLFQFGNYHYFKWCIPVFGLYATFLLTEVAGRRVAAWGAGLLLVTFLFSWRLAWREIPSPWLSAATRTGRTLVLPHAPRSVYEGLFVPADGGLPAIYLASYQMRIGQRVFASNADFKALPVARGFIFTALRPMPDGPAEVTFAPGVRLGNGPMRMLRATLFWRWPHIPAVALTYLQRWRDAT